MRQLRSRAPPCATGHRQWRAGAHSRANFPAHFHANLRALSRARPQPNGRTHCSQQTPSRRRGRAPFGSLTPAPLAEVSRPHSSPTLSPRASRGEQGT
eukprot:4576950-Pleurochrysis_carterae.AAC.1